MTGSNRVRAVAARLRRLDAGTVAALVADLWAARGYETTRDGARVVATTGGSAVVVRVGRGADERPPDVVVSLGGRDPTSERGPRSTLGAGNR